MATGTKSATALETFAREDRTFPPPKDFAAKANAKDRWIYDRADKDLEGFWAEQANTLQWRKPFTKVLEWHVPYGKEVDGGEDHNSEDSHRRHLEGREGAQDAHLH